MALQRPVCLLDLFTNSRMELLKARHLPTTQPCTSPITTTMPRVGSMEEAVVVHITSTMLRHRQVNSNTTHSNRITSNSLEGIPNMCMFIKYLAQVTALAERLVAYQLYSLVYAVRV
ncbi:hypothetical protein GGH94_005141 [Coemansia aciculifera]|uniref:Uncharacterized protein n=1 Tax=Coemansia aciculifera TaxID=417176 RepID=A0A9W8IGR1_9FUNG|nr:hypothetical protein GGH94_005141 [Coemansia aciculifera]KAJ2872217.1 hypothetical protein GGH93_004200 [Coemansia aciculifera]